MMCNVENAFADEQIYELMKKQPEEREHVLVYEARMDLILNRLDSAQQKLTQALALNKNNLEAWVWDGYVKAASDQWEALSVWLQQRPPEFERHPQFWNVLGSILQHNNMSDQAIQAYKNTLNLDPRSPTATSQIAKVLIDLDQTELAEAFRQRGLLLTKSNALVRDVLANLQSEKIQEVAMEYAKLGDSFLAEEWQKVYLFFSKQNQASPNATPAPPSPISLDATLALGPMLAKLDALNLKPLVLEDIARPNNEQLATQSEATNHITFTDVTQSAGLSNARYDWGRTEEETGIYVFRSLGGGVGVLDFDLNGFPDLFFSRAGDVPSRLEKNNPKQLFRNLNGVFQEVDHAKHTLVDRGYGQAIACGDFNQDGFADLLVTNIGSCTLHQNNGDGTFELVYSVPLDKKNKWVSACAIADINKDTLPDLVVATYFEDSDYETREM